MHHINRIKLPQEHDGHEGPESKSQGNKTELRNGDAGEMGMSSLIYPSQHITTRRYIQSLKLFSKSYKEYRFWLTPNPPTAQLMVKGHIVVIFWTLS